jgi:hypothetical protein
LLGRAGAPKIGNSRKQSERQNIMLTFNGKNKQRVLVLVAALVLGLTMTVPALADNTVTQQVSAGTRSASIANATLLAVNYSHNNQTNTGTMTLTADDSTGSNLGWNVTVQAGNFVDGAKTIAASNFSITGYGSITVNAGQAIDTAATPPGGPKTGATGTLDTARKVFLAEAGYGKGNYSLPINVSLTILGQTLAGTYVSNLTVTIAQGPGGA